MLYVGFNDDSAVVEVSLLLFGFLGENVAVVGVLTLDFACTSKFEALL